MSQDLTPVNESEISKAIEESEGKHGFVLYHYTSMSSLKAISTQGLRKGHIPLFKYLKDEKKVQVARRLKGYQWLTVSSEWDNQQWAKDSELLKGKRAKYYDYTEVRVTVEIPRMFRNKLHKWSKWVKTRNNIIKATGIVLDEMWETKAWYIYNGIIYPKWIKTVQQNPIYIKESNPPEPRYVEGRDKLPTKEVGQEKA